MIPTSPNVVKNTGVIFKKMTPYFLSAGLFLSGFFAVFAPLPLLFVGITQGPLWVLLAAITNCALVYLASGPALFQFYALAFASLGVLLPLFLVRQKLKIESTAAALWLSQVGLLILLVFVYSQMHGLTLFEELQQTFTRFFDTLLVTLRPEAREQLFGELTEAAWREKTLWELPAAIATLVLVCIWINLYLILTLNPNRVLSKKGLDRKAFFKWRTSPHMVWPTIIAWAVVLLGEGKVEFVALNTLKFLMAVYAIQGVAVITSVFDAWRIRGIWRTLLFALILFGMLPLLLGIGFFDQWFDFRTRIRQSKGQS